MWDCVCVPDPVCVQKSGGWLMIVLLMHYSEGIQSKIVKGETKKESGHCCCQILFACYHHNKDSSPLHLCVCFDVFLFVCACEHLYSVNVWIYIPLYFIQYLYDLISFYKSLYISICASYIYIVSVSGCVRVFLCIYIESL